MLSESMQRMAAAASAMGASSFEPVGGIDVSIGGAEAAIGELAAASGRVAYIMPDRVHRFERLTMRGLEMQLLLMDILVRTRGLRRGRGAPATPPSWTPPLPPAPPPLIPRFSRSSTTSSSPRVAPLSPRWCWQPP